MVDKPPPLPTPALVEEKEGQPTQKEDEEAGTQIPPPTQHQPLGLQDTCVKTLARHLEVFAHPRHRFRVIPIDLFLRILRGCHSHAWVQAADTMLRVVRIMPCLDAPEVDDLYWKTVCELTLSPTTPITMPYPILVGRVVELKLALEQWMAAAANRAAAIVAAGANQEEGQQNGKAEAEGSATSEKKGKKEKEGDKEEMKGEKDVQQGKSSKKNKRASSSPNEEEGQKKKKKEKRENKDSSTTSSCSISEKEKKRKIDESPRAVSSSSCSSGRSSSSSTAKAPTKQQQQQEDQASAAVLRLLRELSRLPMSVQLLKDAEGVGDAVRQLSKMRTKEGGKEGGRGLNGHVVVSEEVARTAIKLRRQWKALVQQEQDEKVGKKEEEKGKINGEEEEKSDDPMSPARVGARALAALTWRDVYGFSLEYEEHRRGWIGKRALALAEDHESKKRRTRGIEEKLGDAATIEAEARKGKPPVGNTDRIRKLIKYKPTMSMESQKRPFGGIGFVAPQKKKNLKVVKLR